MEETQRDSTECGMGKSNLVRLKEVTAALEFSDFVRSGAIPELKELILEKGTSYMVGLFKSPTVAIARVFSSGGSEFSEHQHNEWELILVLSGEIHLTVEDKTKILKEKAFYYVNPGQVHSAVYPVDSWVLCVTMPASESFPEGG